MAKKNKIDTIIEELQNASKMHLRQSKELSSHVEDMTEKSPLKQEESTAKLVNLPKSTIQGGNIGALGGVSKNLFKIGKKIASNMISPTQPLDEVKASKYAKAIQEIKPF
jgi:hypothetical protein|tara:strand:+ start:70 stop:399 length:330 start_codon:yes stop_codon:yes gene_type:complete